MLTRRGFASRCQPSNVLLASDDRIYLADFGLARMAEAGESTLSADMMLGTPQYISQNRLEVSVIWTMGQISIHLVFCFTSWLWAKSLTAQIHLLL